jgi:Ser/Thr protein kinase RdoA (MazF antagonist)
MEVLDEARVVSTVKEFFGMDGRVSCLGSCQDINFKFTKSASNDSDVEESYVVKFTNTELCSKKEIDFQHSIITYLHSHPDCAEFAFPLPLRLLKLNECGSGDHQYVQDVTVSDSKYMVRLLKFVKGNILSDYKYFAPEVLYKFGEFVATVSLSLLQFDSVMDNNPQFRDVADRKIEW